MEKEKYADAFLEKRIAKYDQWLGKGRISYVSEVIPVSESLTTKQWEVPTEQAMEILGKANSAAVQNSECRTHYQRWGNPLEVCFLLNDLGDKLVTKGKARHIAVKEFGKTDCSPLSVVEWEKTVVGY